MTLSCHSVFEQCPPEVSPVDAWLALDYFGFPAQDLDITLADDDPSKMYKAMKFAAFKRTKSAVPKLIDFVKETIQKDCCSSNVSGKGKDRDQNKGHLGFHFLVSALTLLSLVLKFTIFSLTHSWLSRLRRKGHMVAGKTF